MLLSTVTNCFKGTNKVSGILLVLSCYDKYADEETKMKGSDEETKAKTSARQKEIRTQATEQKRMKKLEKKSIFNALPYVATIFLDNTGTNVQSYRFDSAEHI